MPIINEGAVKPRVSTVGPVDIPRWENPMGVEVPDFSGLIAPQGGTWEQSKPVITEAPKLTLGDLSLTKDNPLSLDGLTMTAPKVKDWTTAFAPAPKYVPAKLDAAQKSTDDYRATLASQVAGNTTGILGFAKQFLGMNKYVYGGWDCSAYTQKVAGLAGISIGRDTASQMAFFKSAGKFTSLANARPGDVIYLKSGASASGRHTGIYVGNGMMIDNSGRGKPIDIGKFDANRVIGVGMLSWMVKK